ERIHIDLDFLSRGLQSVTPRRDEIQSASPDDGGTGIGESHPSDFAGSNPGHPGHDSIGGAGAGTSAGVESPDQGDTGRPIESATGSWNGLRQQIPSATVPVALAVFFLALMPHRRGALALGLVLLFGVVSFEGVFHAASRSPRG